MKVRRSLLAVLVFSVATVFAPASSVSAMPGSITGSFFVDLNRNGVVDPTEDSYPANDSFYPSDGITVTAYDDEDGSTACAVTGTSYSCDVSSLAGTEFRIEFGISAADKLAGYNETFGHNSSVQFVADGGTAIYGVTPPSSCPMNGTGFEGNPNSNEGKLFVTCHVAGQHDTTNLDGLSDVVVALNYESTGSMGDFPVEHLGYKNSGGSADNGDNSELGTVWGLAFDEWNSTLFASAMLKRHSTQGARGMDGLYWLDYDGGTWQSTDLDNLGGPSYGADLTNRGIVNFTPSYDVEAYALGAKRGIGDIDVTPDGRTLIVTNLEARAVMVYDVSAVPTGGNPVFEGFTPIVNPGCPDTTNTDDYQIWAVNVADQNTALIGVTCTAQNSNNQDADGFDLDLAAHIVPVDISTPATPTQGASILSVPLAYPRGCGHASPACSPNQSFSKWQDVWNPTSTFVAPNVIRVTDNQPVFSDIEILDDGSMVLGFFDRHTGTQIGSQNRSTDINDPELYSGTSAGEMLHVCNTTGDPQNVNLVVEGLEGCDSTNRFPNPAHGLFDESDSHGGPYVDAEWYGRDKLGLLDNGVKHTEVSQGGLYHRPFTDEIIATVIDPIVISTSGLAGIPTLPGDTSIGRPIELVTGGRGASGKAGSFGDVDGCFVPTEIGNYVWLDLDNDGIQDPGEIPLEGVTVTLYEDDGVTFIASTTTDVNGEYYFNTSDGLAASTTYVLDFDQSTNVTTLPAGWTSDDLFEAPVDVGAGMFPDTTDSDIVDGRVTVETGLSGTTDHSFDAGFSLPYDLALTKTLNSVDYSAGTVVFDITITNQSVAVQSISVTDYIQTGLVYDPASNAAGTVNDTGNGESFNYVWGGVAGDLAPVLSISPSSADDTEILDYQESLTVPLTLNFDDNWNGSEVINWAEIYNFDSDTFPDDGDALDATLIDQDSTPDQVQSNDAQPDGPGDAGDDVIDGNGLDPDPIVGDEDDHDIASVPRLVFDLALRKTLATTASATPGTTVTFNLEVFNQGTVDAFEPSLVDYVPAGLVLADADWVLGADGNATTTLTGQTIKAGESVVVEITFTVAANPPANILNTAEITEATPVDANGETIVMPNGLVLSDIDSVPDSDNSDALTDDAIDNADGDEDDHDIASLTTARLALTGTSTKSMLLVALLAIASGFVLVTRTRRKSLA